MAKMAKPKMSHYQATSMAEYQLSEPEYQMNKKQIFKEYLGVKTYNKLREFDDPYEKDFTDSYVEGKIRNLESHINYLSQRNDRLRHKLAQAEDHFQQTIHQMKVLHAALAESNAEKDNRQGIITDLIAAQTELEEELETLRKLAKLWDKDTQQTETRVLDLD